MVLLWQAAMRKQRAEGPEQSEPPLPQHVQHSHWAETTLQLSYKFHKKLSVTDYNVGTYLDKNKKTARFSVCPVLMVQFFSWSQTSQ